MYLCGSYSLLASAWAHGNKMFTFKFNRKIGLYIEVCNDLNIAIHYFSEFSNFVVTGRKKTLICFWGTLLRGFGVSDHQKLKLR